jgi:hypothetical protein
LITQALKEEEISIHMAWKWSNLAAEQQLEKLEEYRSRKGTNLTSRRLIQKHVARLSPKQLIPLNLGDLLRPLGPGKLEGFDSIVVSEIDLPGRIAYFTKTALDAIR